MLQNQNKIGLSEQTVTEIIVNYLIDFIDEQQPSMKSLSLLAEIKSESYFKKLEQFQDQALNEKSKSSIKEAVLIGLCAAYNVDFKMVDNLGHH